MIRKYQLILFILFIQILAFAQEQAVPVTPKLALETFRQGDYEQAYEMYSKLITKSPKDSRYNFYLGICEIKTNKNISGAVKHLKYAAIRGISRDVYYYLGRAYQLNYNFKEAIAAFDRFLKYAKQDDIRREKAEQYKKESETGESMSTKIYYLQVISKDTVSKENILSMYHPVKDVGYIFNNRDFFESGLDPNGILYLTERKDEVYFSMPQDSMHNQDLYKMEKLLDGWSDPIPLKEINSEYDDLYPYLMIDGVTLYFSSNREGGLGGYDIYKTVYDPDTKSFSEPVNMGIPFNSPRDDYFFVTDEFTGVAWFTSNRYTSGDKVMVYQIIWDKSVVKNMVYEEKDIKIASTMPLLENIPEKYKALKNKSKEQTKKATVKALFNFKVTDDVTYTDFSQFRSKEALEIFRKGYVLQQEKDSLSAVMQNKRQEYSKTTQPDKKNKLVNEILALEKQVYGLDSKINDYYYQARSIEQPIVEKLIREGKYNPARESTQESTDNSGLNNILIPAEYSYYTDEEFAKHLQKLEMMYKKVFPPETVKKLKHADSLYVWGNILTLESSKLMEQANKETENKEIVISSFFNQQDNKDQTEDKTAELVKKARELKNTALKLYHASLDQKFNIFKNKIKEVVLSQPTVDFTFMEERQAEANAYYRKAVEDINSSLAYNPEQYEKEGALKREAVNLQEEALLLYMQYLDGNTSVQDSLMNNKAEKENRSYQEIQGGEEAVKEAEAAGKKVTTTKKTNPVYKIQIGVFRNTPDEEVLKKLPSVSKIPIPDKGLTKYFAGEYPSYEEAQKDLQKVRDLGFSGAFIVAFYNGKRISVSKAKELSH